jgi:tRNA pseudouridine38-40 synthase
MVRYALRIEYDGTPFVGWQIQAEGLTVQGCLVEAIARMSGERVNVQGAGRTDSGVHALGQVAHFDLVRPFAPGKVQDALNYHLKPAPIAITACREVPSTFDARRTASARRYLYRILPRRAPPVMATGRVWWVPIALDAQQMHAAAQRLTGHHDFTTFRASMCQAASPMRTLDRLDVAPVGEEVHIVAQSRSFLHNQVRSLVGSLKLVGEGRWSGNDLRAALDAANRTRCGPVAPPDGLYLTDVVYGDHDVFG